MLLSLENPFLSNYGCKDFEAYLVKGWTYNIDQQLSSQTSILELLWSNSSKRTFVNLALAMCYEIGRITFT